MMWLLCWFSDSFRRRFDWRTADKALVKNPLTPAKAGAHFRHGSRPPSRLSGNLRNPSFRGSGAAREPGTHERGPAPAWDEPVFIGSGPGPLGPSRNDAHPRASPDSLPSPGGRGGASPDSLPSPGGRGGASPDSLPSPGG